MKINLSDHKSVKRVITQLNNAGMTLKQKTANANRRLADQAVENLRDRLPPDVKVTETQLPDGRYRIEVSGDGVIQAEYGAGVSKSPLPLDEISVPKMEPYFMYKTGKEIQEETKEIKDETMKK